MEDGSKAFGHGRSHHQSLFGAVLKISVRTSIQSRSKSTAHRSDLGKLMASSL